MNTTQDLPESPPKEQSAPKRRKHRKDKAKYGIRLPYVTFEDAIRITREVSKLGGFDGSVDVLSKVTGNSSSSSSFTVKMIAIKGFGLLTLDSQTYSLTEIGKRIAQPDSPEAEAQAIFEAFSQHEILAKVWESYKGKILPQAEYLANHFETNHNIPAERKHLWPPYFIDAAKYAGLLHEREAGSYQVLLAPSAVKKTDADQGANGKNGSKSSPKKPETQIEALTKNPALPSIEVTESEHWGILSQRRISGNRKAVIAIPDELLQEDIDMLKQILKGIEVQLDGLKKYEA